MLPLILRFAQKAFIVAITGYATYIYADDKATNPDDDLSGGFLKLGIGLGSASSPFWDKNNGVKINLTGRYQWKGGLFTEFPGLFSNADAYMNNGPSVGWNFLNTEQWNFDVIAPLIYGATDYEETNESGETLTVERNNELRLGLRATGSFDNYFVQFSGTTFPFKDQLSGGIVASAWGGKRWQIKNWNLFSAIGLRYESQKVLDYYFGIPEHESSELTPEYEADSGVNLRAQLGVSYPISKKWVFEGALNYTKFSDSIMDSPVIVNTMSSERTEDQLLTSFTINYVF